MKITITLEEDELDTKTDMTIEDTEVDEYKWITFAEVKYSVLTKDLVKLLKLLD